MNRNIIKEYYTPDNLSDGEINLSWRGHGCYPFINTNYGILYGDEGDSHNSMTSQLIALLCDVKTDVVDMIERGQYDYQEDDETQDVSYILADGTTLDRDEFDSIKYYTEGQGMYELDDYASDFGRIWPCCGVNNETYISVWLNNRFNEYYGMDMPWDDDNDDVTNKQFDVTNSSSMCENDFVPSNLSDSSVQVLVEVLKHFNCDLNNSFVCIGNTKMPITKLMNGGKMEITQDMMDKDREEQAIHLMPPEKKRDILKLYRDTVAQKLSDKLAMHDKNGNYKGEMPLAQYHSLIYQENKRHGNKKLTEQRLHKIIDENINKFINEVINRAKIIR